jgi:predicted PurR-regulated permease PerM
MIILALMVFGKVFGIVGILLALPLSTIAVVLLRHTKRYYQNTHYYKD